MPPGSGMKAQYSRQEIPCSLGPESANAGPSLAA
jgi:hypothetical protein